MRHHASVVVEHDVAGTMRDGTVLRADIYRPTTAGPHPVLLCRTPYDKTWQRFVDDATTMASHGYIVAVQDVRGRYASDGDFRWQFRDRDETPEGPDGYDSVEWCSLLPGSTGEVGLWGHSYDAWNGWMAAATRPPSLKALVASGISQNLHDLTPGIFETGRRLLWTYKMAADMRRRDGRVSGPTTPVEAMEAWDHVLRGKYMWRLPLSTIPPDVFGPLTEQFQTYLRNQDKEFWELGDFHAEVDVPVLQITGWWDRLIGAADNYTGLVLNGQEHLRRSHRLIIGPWGHDVTGFDSQTGPIDHGPMARRRYADMLVRWFDRVIKGIDDGVSDEEPVELFILGSDRWERQRSWPIPDTTDLVLHLTATDGANTVDGDGALVRDQPVVDGLDRFSYDPTDPVMSLMAPDFQAAPVDQSMHDHRDDILIYETPPLTADLEVTGSIRLVVWAATDGPDTDWAATLAIVHEDGTPVNLTYGIVRARYREGVGTPSFVQPGEPYEYTIALNPIGCRFAPGQRIRLYLTSSDFPNFDRNHNTGNDFWDDLEMRTASQTVFHGPSMPSRLILPRVGAQ